VAEQLLHFVRRGGRSATEAKDLSSAYNVDGCASGITMRDMTKICWLVDLGHIPYAPAYDLQRQLVAARKARAIPDVLLLCEHPHVITLGRNGTRDHLRVSDELLRANNVEFHSSDRGGDITYHGPGQIVGYPILDLTEHQRDIGWYVSQLEDVMMRVTADYGLAAKRVAGQHGAWLDTPRGEEKLGALGVHLSRWVTSHGFAYNVSADLSYFDLIVPCGIAGKGVTSLEKTLGRPVAIDEARNRIAGHFAALFGFQMKSVGSPELAEILRAAPVAAASF
jgi:lipoyl(octanoyl) transferase